MTVALPRHLVVPPRPKPHKETALSRVPVWIWRAIMHRMLPGELHKFNEEPIDDVDYTFDIDYSGDGVREHRLDVMVPHDAESSLPVSYTHLRAHETDSYLVCRLLL